MATRKNSRRQAVGRRAAASNPSLRERLTAVETSLNAALDALPEKIGFAVREAVSDLASSAAVADIAARLKLAEERIVDLSTRNAYAAGAQKVEDRVRGQVQQWVQTLTPIIWPLIGAAFVATQAMP